MVRGCQKKIVYLKNTGSDLFLEAYFVVSDKELLGNSDECDIVKEAEKILNESISLDVYDGRLKKIFRFFKRVIIPFLVGLALGIIITIIIK